MSTPPPMTVAAGEFTAQSQHHGQHHDPLSEFDHVPEQQVPIASLVPGFYLRESGTSAAHVQALAEVAASSPLPPVLIQRNGLRIIDGMHRLAAARLRQQQHISARLIDCTDAEALVLAIKANIQHGLPLTRADRISGAKRVLAAHPDWSDRAVAEIAGLGGRTIAVLRNRSSSEDMQPDKRLGRDGKRRPMVAADGRRRAVDYIQAHPEAPLREVAREVDVSLGTVHDVRERLRRGTDPIACATRPPCPSASTDPHAVTAPQRGSGPAGPTPPPTWPRRGEQVSWPAVAPKLASDPTLRYTEGGRAFIRWMTLHALHVDQWVEFVDAVPEHWRDELGHVADTICGEWHMFAQQLKTSGDHHSAAG
jgi:ParB-like chromosome segregation protein Spo0J